MTGEPELQDAAVASSLTGELLEGTILDGSRGQYRVDTPAGLLLCTLRGRLRKTLIYPTSANRHGRADHAAVKGHDPVAVGMRVRVLPLGNGQGVIEDVLATGNTFQRDDPSNKGQITPVAGLDQIVTVFAARDPEPHLGLLDRFLVTAEAGKLPAVICLNKVDLRVDAELEAALAIYPTLGYPVIFTSVETGRGIEELRARLAGRTSALLGPSGVGKSSLLNALEPGLALRVSHVGETTHKGRHTTTGTRLVPLGGPAGGYLADTAGIRSLAVQGVAEGQLAWCFPEFRPYLDACRWPGCKHLDDPGCAVQDAVASGAIAPSRYDSYAKFYAEGAGAAAQAWRDTV